MTAASSTKAEKKARAEAIARSLGVTFQELRQARRMLTEAEANVGAAKGKKAEFVARRLDMTPGELKELRAGLQGTVSSTRAKLLVRRVLRLEAPRSSDERGSGAVAKARAASPGRRRGTLPTDAAWTLSTLVYVTDLGDAVHCYHDCRGLRGFRYTHEPDPVVHQVELRESTCIGRLACRICLGSIWSPAGLDALDRRIQQLHGDLSRIWPSGHLSRPARQLAIGRETLPESQSGTASDRLRREAARQGISLQEAVGLGPSRVVAKRAPPQAPGLMAAARVTPQPTAAQQPMMPLRPPVATAKEGKVARDKAAARALGISLEELKEHRRAEEAENLALNAKAKTLGTTVRELRRRLPQ